MPAKLLRVRPEAWVLRLNNTDRDFVDDSVGAAGIELQGNEG